MLISIRAIAQFRQLLSRSLENTETATNSKKKKKSSIYRQHSQFHTYLWRAFLRKMLISCSLTSIGFSSISSSSPSPSNCSFAFLQRALNTKRNVPTHLAQAIWNRCIPIMKWKSFESPLPTLLHTCISNKPSQEQIKKGEWSKYNRKILPFSS